MCAERPFSKGFGTWCEVDSDGISRQRRADASRSIVGIGTRACSRGTGPSYS